MNAEKQASPTTKPWWDEQADDDADVDRPSPPLVLVDHGPKGTRISASSPEAMALGLWPDMKLADARTMVPVLRVEQHDTQADRTVLARLAKWLMRYSPAVSMQGNDGFALDITGCAHLFGGETGLAQDMADRLDGFGFCAVIAVADTLAAAIALVMHGRDPVTIVPHDHGPAMLDDLPVEALRLDDETIILLKRLGLKQTGDVRRIPRAALERRFRERGSKSGKASAHATAQSVQMRLDHLSGALAEPQTWLSEPPIFRAVLQCPDFALEAEAVGNALDRLLPELCESLSKAGHGGRHFILHAYRADGGVSAADVRLSQPLHDPAIIRRMFRDRLEAIDCGFGIDLFVLSAGGVELIAINQNDMVSGRSVGQERASLTAFADTVANRVGRSAVVRYAPRTSHVPERAQRSVPVATEPDWSAFEAAKPALSPRPLRLLERPEEAKVTADLPDGPPAQFVWRKVLRRVVRARGPERILPEWWHDSLKAKRSAVLRDYYDVEDSEGRRYWLFRAVHDVAVMDDHETECGTTAERERPDGWNHGGRLQNPAIETQPVRESESVQTSQWFVHGFF